MEKTLAAQKAAAGHDEAIARLRKMYEAVRPLNLDAGMTILDNEALGSPFPSSEYRFFHLHRHDGIVCGKAWHHEDRFDPGDVSRCYVQLELIDDRLRFRSLMTEGLPNPERAGAACAAAGGPGCAEKCKAKVDKDWSQWTVFVRAVPK